METKESERSERQKRQEKNSNTRFNWEDFERLELQSSRDLIDDIEIDTFFEPYSELEAFSVIDIFPYQVPEGSDMYWDVEKYFLETEMKNFISKCIKIILKISCYYPYTNVIVSHCGMNSDFDDSLYDEEEGIYYGDPIEYQSDVVAPIIVEKTEEFVNKVFDTLGNPSIFFYFKSVDILIGLYPDELVATVKSLNIDDKFLKLLGELVTSEGLFLRQ